eukprot:CAMPEP_0170550426 /NCGR_PEP_ID=MMETSP0211-20121228/8497_1 /TAXON_ID=311385 /ORGANISM="Pseudokeronopsis sp., Strain OXSARD2" /LENGTH=189 /DNA_ID=CAMNT_0010856975 /DNA_START=527 /DNA_END=1092 /DNA_ORIENTATION=+
MGLIYCAIVPLIAIFDLIFFFFKHYIDKYNLTFVYNKSFEGGGVIKNSVMPFMIFSILVFQILNIAYFYLLTGHNGYWIGGLIFLIFEVVCLVLGRVVYVNRKKEIYKQQLMGLVESCEMMEEEDDDETPQPKEDDSTVVSSFKKNFIYLREFLKKKLTLDFNKKITFMKSSPLSPENEQKLKEAYKHP